MREWRGAQRRSVRSINRSPGLGRRCVDPDAPRRSRSSHLAWWQQANPRSWDFCRWRQSAMSPKGTRIPGALTISRARRGQGSKPGARCFDRCARAGLRYHVLSHVSVGSKCERLSVSKSSPHFIRKRKSPHGAAASAAGRQLTTIASSVCMCGETQSITLSARANTNDGTSSPNVSAALGLTTSWYLVGVCTGLPLYPLASRRLATQSDGRGPASWLGFISLPALEAASVRERRQVPGGTPTCFLNARLKASSDS